MKKDEIKNIFGKVYGTQLKMCRYTEALFKGVEEVAKDRLAVDALEFNLNQLAGLWEQLPQDIRVVFFNIEVAIGYWLSISRPLYEVDINTEVIVKLARLISSEDRIRETQSYKFRLEEVEQ